MAYELREGQGSLFRNDKREGDKQPHARGEALIDGVLYEVAAWTKEGRKGKFQSLSFKPKQDRAKQQPEREDHTSYGTPNDDDLPF